MRRLPVTIVWVAAVLALVGFSLPARAEITDVRVGGVYGLVNLPVYVVEDRHLIEAHTADAGMSGVTVTPTQVSGGATAADLLLSGNVDVSGVGATNMMVLWDRTRVLHTQQVRGMLALCDSPMSLVTVDPRINSLRDFTDADRIAVTSIKVSVQALVLQMAAAKEFGWDGRTKLDPLMVMMPHEDGMAALLSGGAQVRTQAAQLPYSLEELQSGKGHLLLTSTQVLGGPSNLGVLITNDRFHSQNPKVYAAVMGAFEEAIDWINANKRQAAELYVRHEPQKKGADWVYEMLQDPAQISFTSVPHGTQKFTDFMFRSGLLRNQPASWKDLYWDNAWSKDGN
jgi:NitT/TauT family transport system substrate-binding protein